MGGRLTVFLAILAIACLVPGRGAAEERRLDQLEKRLQNLEQKTQQAGDPQPWPFVVAGFDLLAISAFCALWARCTGRDPWLWLAAGLVFNLFVLLAVWAKHEGDKKAAKAADTGGPFEWTREGEASSQNIRAARADR